MPGVTIPRATMGRWCSVHVDKAPHRRHLNVDSTLDLNRSIYRYMQPEYLLSLIRTRELYFSHVGSWPDPFEHWWHSILFDGDSPLKGARAFATCWTWRCRDEPFWRLHEQRCDHRDERGERYPKGPPPVRIKSTLKRIIDAVSIPLRDAEAKVFVAPVGYVTTKELLRHRSSLATAPAEIAREAAHALTYKRLGFQYEKEVRILWIDRSPVGVSRQIPVDAGLLIDEVMIGPVPEDQKERAHSVRQQLRDAGYKGQIKRSLIYRPPR